MKTVVHNNIVVYDGFHTNKYKSVVFRGSQEKKERNRLKVRKKHNEEQKDKWNMK